MYIHFLILDATSNSIHTSSYKSIARYVEYSNVVSSLLKTDDEQILESNIYLYTEFVLLLHTWSLKALIFCNKINKVDKIEIECTRTGSNGGKFFQLYELHIEIR